MLKKSLPRRSLLLAFLLVSLPGFSHAAVVINEIMYHPPDDLPDLQFIELHNSSDTPVDLTGWSLSDAIKYTFPSGQRLDPKSYLVLAHNPSRFQETYGTQPSGKFELSFRHKGDRVELKDPSGKLVDAVKFNDKAPWPTGPDGYSGSLERITPDAAGNDPANWASSPLSEDRAKPAGTPGKPNHNFRPALPPVIDSVSFTPEIAAPDQPVIVQARLRPGESPSLLRILYRVAGPGFEKPEFSIEMEKVSDHTYSATIPGQSADQLIRFRVQALSKSETSLYFPAETEPRPALTAYVQAPFEPALVPFAWIIHTTETEFNSARQRATSPPFERSFGPPGAPRPPGRGDFRPPGPGQFREPSRPGGPGPRGFGGPGRRGGPFGGPPSEPGSHRSAFVYFDPATKKTQLFDFVQVSTRKGGVKVRFLKDQLLNQMSTINLIFEGETSSIVEPLAYEVYRRAGMATEQSYHLRLWQSGTPVGYHLLVEQPNSAFLRRNKINDEGNMYKLLWYEQGVVGQHEKKGSPGSTHEDIVALVKALNETSGAAQWEVIRKNFDVNQVATYFAVNMVLSHWDGFFNNYFTYHDVNGTGKWTMYPWDQDSTWGLRDMRGGDVFYTMALSFGMNGARPQGSGGMWWRPPGWFSGPLLANPEFRKIFLARTKEILDTIYTEQVFQPVLARMQQQLEPEYKLRAQLQKRDPAAAVAQLKSTIASCLDHLRKRRQFLLTQTELKSVAKLQ